MTTELLIQDVAGSSLSEIVFGVTASFAPADDGTNMSEGDAVTALITCSAVADGAGRQSDKIDLGALRSELFALYGVPDFTGETPPGTGSVEAFWAPSPSATQANGNLAGNSGADGACPDGALGSIIFDEFTPLCQFIGSFSIHNGAVVQNGLVGVFSPWDRYGQLIVGNQSGDAFEADDVEMHWVLRPIVREGQ